MTGLLAVAFGLVVLWVLMKRRKRVRARRDLLSTTFADTTSGIPRMGRQQWLKP